MCVVSMVGDFYGDRWKPYFPTQPILPPSDKTTPLPPLKPAVPKEDFDKLKKEVEDMKELLRRAKIYDEKNGEPDCEIDEKLEKLRAIAKIFDIDLDDVLKKKSS